MVLLNERFSASDSYSLSCHHLMSRRKGAQSVKHARVSSKTRVQQVSVGHLGHVMRAKVSSKQASPSRKSRPQRDAGWKRHHEQYKKTHAITGSWTAAHPLQCRGLPLGGREQDLVDIAVSECQERQRRKTGGGLSGQATEPLDMIIDVSQSLSRTPWSVIGEKPLGSLTTSSTLFWKGGGRMIAPAEHFKLLGWQAPKIPSRLSATAQRDLAGEAMPLPPMAVLLLSMMCSLPGYWSNEPGE